jgi:hypothetical protein
MFKKLGIKHKPLEREREKLLIHEQHQREK